MQGLSFSFRRSLPLWSESEWRHLARCAASWELYEGNEREGSLLQIDVADCAAQARFADCIKLVRELMPVAA